MFGFFKSLFDFNHDGELSALERTAGYALFEEMMEDEEETDDWNNDDNDNWDNDDWNNDDWDDSDV